MAGAEAKVGTHAVGGSMRGGRVLPRRVRAVCIGEVTSQLVIEDQGKFDQWRAAGRDSMC